MQLFPPKQIGPCKWEVVGRLLDEPHHEARAVRIIDTQGTVSPEKCLHYHHNKMRNEVTQALIELKYGE